MNDDILIEFSDRDPRLGIRPQDVLKISTNLFNLLSRTGEFDDFEQLVITAIQPGSLRIFLRAVADSAKKEIKKAPIALAIAAAPVIHETAAALTKAFEALVSMHLAEPVRPLNYSEPVSVDGELRRTCSDFYTALRSCEPGDIVVYGPDVEPVRIVSLETANFGGGNALRQAPIDAPSRRFAGSFVVTEPGRARYGRPDDVVVASIEDAAGARIAGSALILTGRFNAGPRMRANSRYAVEGVFLSRDEAFREPKLQDWCAAHPADFRSIDAVLLVRSINQISRGDDELGPADRG